MRFDLKASFTFSNDISSIKNEMLSSISEFNKTLFEKDKSVKIKVNNIQKDIRKNFPSSEAKISLILTELEEKGIIKKIKRGRGNIIVLK